MFLSLGSDSNLGAVSSTSSILSLLWNPFDKAGKRYETRMFDSMEDSFDCLVLVPSSTNPPPIVIVLVVKRSFLRF